jgi:hypothetical protein
MAFLDLIALLLQVIVTTIIIMATAAQLVDYNISARAKQLTYD